LSLLLFAALSLFSREIVVLLTAPEFHPAYHVIPVLVPSALISSMYIFAPGLDLAKRTGRIAGINVLGAVLNSVLCFILVRKYGVVGAAAGTLISSFVVFLLYMSQSQSLYRVPHSWKKLIAASSTVVLMVVAGLYFYPASPLGWG